MRNIRTDLALERMDVAKDNLPAGITQQVRQQGRLKITMIDVIDKQGQDALQKPIGRYITVETKGFESASPTFEEDVLAVADLLRPLLPKNANSALIIGLGNANITPDALGPQVVRHTLATRHISGELAKSIGLGGLKPVCALAPGVLGQTGIETAEIVHAVSEQIRPDVVIAIDALAAKSVTRLGNTIQISNTGISPGSGVLNRRKELSTQTLGIPVISIGVPTVVDLHSIAQDFEGKLDLSLESNKNMMVTPREIDVLIEHAAKTIAYALGICLQPSLGLEELVALTA